jgi:hypothetical protein
MIGLIALILIDSIGEWMFLGLPDPDTLVRGPGPDPSIFSKLLSGLK